MATKTEPSRALPQVGVANAAVVCLVGDSGGRRPAPSELDQMSQGADVIDVAVCSVVSFSVKCHPRAARV